jgi:hypothetical protein
VFFSPVDATEHRTAFFIHVSTKEYINFGVLQKVKNTKLNFSVSQTPQIT